MRCVQRQTSSIQCNKSTRTSATRGLTACINLEMQVSFLITMQVSLAWTHPCMVSSRTGSNSCPKIALMGVSCSKTTANITSCYLKAKRKTMDYKVFLTRSLALYQQLGSRTTLVRINKSSLGTVSRITLNQEKQLLLRPTRSMIQVLRCMMSTIETLLTLRESLKGSTRAQRATTLVWMREMDLRSLTLRMAIITICAATGHPARPRQSDRPTRALFRTRAELTCVNL